MSNNAKQLQTLIQARYPIIYIVSHEEDRVLATLKEVADARKMDLSSWTITDGLTSKDKTEDPMAVLKAIAKTDSKARVLYVLKDFHPYMKEPPIVRKLRDCAALARGQVMSIVLVGPVQKIPTELEKVVYVMDWDLPNREEIRTVALALAKQIGEEYTAAAMNEIVNAATGLTLHEVENVLARSAVAHGTLDVAEVSREKEQIIKKSGHLEFYPAKESMKDVGGHEVLKEWAAQRGDSFTEEAREYRLPMPKGALIVGISGTGKSLTAKAMGKTWGMPTLKLDVGQLFGGIVGESEANTRKMQKIAEACAPCILWVDEIEKGFGGAGGTGDSGTSGRVLGSFLTWMQEKTAPVFVVATANNISALPPEFLRKGRFDEVFFCDLPDYDERTVIAEIQIAKVGRNPSEFDCKVIARASDGYTGAEIEGAVQASLFTAYADKRREPVTGDIVDALEEMVPLSKTMQEDIEAMREWAQKRARRTHVSTDSKDRPRNIELN